MSDFQGRNPFMDYRNIVPFMNLSGFVLRQPNALDEMPAPPIKAQLFKKKFSSMINMRRLQYRVMCEEYRNGRR